MLLLSHIMFLTMFLPVLFVVFGHYINTATAITFPVESVPLTPESGLPFGETPSVLNPIPASAFVPPPSAVTGFNPGAAAFIQEASGIIAAKSVLNEIFNLQELPPLQLRDAYFHSLEHIFEEFHVPDAVNVSNVVSQTILSVADAVTPPVYLNATLSTIGTFLANQGILETNNAPVLAQIYSSTLQNALDAVSAASTSSPHIEALVDGSAGFITVLGISLHDYADELAQIFDDNLIAAKQRVQVFANVNFATAA